MPSFSQAFSEARKAGKKTFTWNGKLYTTAMKGESQTGNRGGHPTESVSECLGPAMMKWKRKAERSLS